MPVFQEEHTLPYLRKFLAASLKYTGKTRKIGHCFHVVIHFHPGHLQPKILINTASCALVG